MQFVPRSGWGARPPRSTTGITGVDGTAFHWEGPRMGEFGHDRCAAKVRGIQAFHMDSRGWADLAYNAVVCYHGYVYEGRGRGRRCAANGTNDGNANFYAVCGLFGDGDPFTEEMRVAYMDARHWLMGGALGLIRPHRSFKATACPGNGVVDWINRGCPTSSTPQPQPQPGPSPAPGHIHSTPLVKNNWVNGAIRGQVFHPEVGKWFVQGTQPWWEIADIQTHLRQHGSDIRVDGFGGPSTNHWIVTFQRATGLNADGIVGSATWAKLHGG